MNELLNIDKICYNCKLIVQLYKWKFVLWTWHTNIGGNYFYYLSSISLSTIPKHSL